MQTKVDYCNPDYVPVLAERQARLLALRTDPRKKSGALRHYKSSAQGCIDFIEDWMFTYDPRREVPWLPFVLFPRQKKYLLWLDAHRESGTGGLVEKSRDVGLTWLSMAYAIWRWRFTETKIGFGSRKQDLVDRLGDPDSIFEKGRMILSNMPVELLPKGFLLDKHFSFLKLVNPQTGATITGEAGDNIGRGGRNEMYFKDESAFYERPMKIEAALSQNTDIQIDISTPNGSGNPFHKKRQSYDLEDVFVFDWKDDPRKNQAWYDEQCRKLDPVIVAQEIDRDYSGSMEGILIPGKWVQAAKELVLPTSGARIAALDVADEGKDANALAFRRGVVCVSVEDWYKGNTAQTTKKAAFECRERRVKELRYDKIGVGAGVKGELSNAGYDDITPVPINSAASPTPGWYVVNEKKNADMFLNYRAQMWWLLRRRFEKTWEHVNKVRAYNYEELISIPNDIELITELSSVTYKHSGSGKIQVESKKDMARRGVRSPNKADALAMCYGPTHVKRGATWGSRVLAAA